MKKNADKLDKAGVVQVAKAIVWAFFGVQNNADHAADVESLSLKQIVIGGIIGAALFVGSLLLLVKFILN